MNAKVIIFSYNRKQKQEKQLVDFFLLFLIFYLSLQNKHLLGGTPINKYQNEE